MKLKRLGRVVLYTFFLALLATAGSAAEEGRYIVKFKSGKANGLAAANAAGARVALEIEGVDAAAVHASPKALEALRQSGAVEYVEEDAKRYLLGAGSGETSPYGIAMVQADQLSYQGGVKVCIIDSGYSVGHEDLQTSNVTGYNDSGTGNWSFDDNGHGTHVAGTISALGGNGKGVVGVNSNGNIQLYIVKVFTAAGWAYSSTLSDAANRCKNAGAKIISMSLGGSTKSRTEENTFDSLNANGVLSIAAAGNDGTNRNSYPASYSSVMSVGALDENFQIASFSQYNSQVEIAAPGVAVLSSTPWLSDSRVTYSGTDYQGAHVENAGHGSFTGTLVSGGLCDSVGSWSNKVVLCQRGTISFYDKVRNAEQGGAKATIIYNNEAGLLYATLGDGNSSSNPAIGISQADGQYLLANAAGASVAVTDTYTFPGSGYEAWDGTSMATPHVSGVAALVWSYNPSWTNTQVRNALNATAVDLGAAGRDVYFGNGLVQAAAALSYLGGGTPNPTPTPGTNPTPTPTTPPSATPTPTPGAGDTTAPVISNVSSANVGGKNFKITWTTNEPADSVVTFTCCGTFSNATLTTSHSMTFAGTRGTTYTYNVSSTDAAGNTATAGPYNHTR